MSLQKISKFIFKFPNDVQPLERRLQMGLFDGRKRQGGYSVSFSEKHNRRSWYPNIQTKKLYSDSLQQFIKMKVSTKALRSIDKAGGLDSYLMKAKDDQLGFFGRTLRRSVLESTRDSQLQNASQ